MKILLLTLLSGTLCGAASAQATASAEFRRQIPAAAASSVEVVNPFGRVTVKTVEDRQQPWFVVTASGAAAVRQSEVITEVYASRFKLTVKASAGKRLDVELRVPPRASVDVTTGEGQVRIDGDFAAAKVSTETGTIAAGIPVSNLGYRFTWTQSRPRYLSDMPLGEVKEKSGGRFVISGSRSEDSSAGPVALEFTTGRGIVLVNVDPDETPSDLSDRPLTDAAKAIVRSGDSLLTSAIARIAPKHFGDYARTVPAPRSQPSLARPLAGSPSSAEGFRRVTVQVLDASNRAVPEIAAAEFEVSEGGEPREVVSVEPASAPFNLVLLLDVSGSIENHVDFIRRAARSFIETADPRDRIAVLVFNDDVKVLSGFSNDRTALSASLDRFKPGGGTAYYDALAFVLVDQLERVRNERSAVVVLSDGDDNRSFLPFESLTGSTQESGALIYPLYVPSGLLANARRDAESSIDPLRRRYMSLTSKAETEGARLAEISGGRYYPIRRLSEIQQAYDDIVAQLRTAYTVTYRSAAGGSGRLKVGVKRDGIFVKAGAQPAPGR